SERRKAYRKYAADLGPEEAVGRRLVRLIRLEKPDRDDLARLLSATLVRSDVGMLGSAMSSQDRARVQFDLAQVMLALAAHRKDHGAYPERLSTLTPKYLPELPPDRFTGKPLTYARDGRGYLLYSRGANGRDDGGEFRRPSADDIAIHVQRSSR
ncbi:MAG: type II secretion system protein, partial [Planctomycetaceae bacterium]